MPVRLRGHHFLCILTYRGAGYSAPFVANMSAMVDRIAAGAKVEVITGPDDICGGLTPACRAASGHDCQRADTMALDRIALSQVGNLLGRGLDGPLTADEFATLRRAFAAGDIRGACAACPWYDFCTDIAAAGYAGVRAYPPSRGSNG
jgi:uncharacterized protein